MPFPITGANAAKGGVLLRERCEAILPTRVYAIKYINPIKMTLQNSLLPVPQNSGQHLLPAPARNLTSGDIQKIQAFLDRSVSDNTRAMYASAWRSFEDWTQARGVPSLPALPELVAAYLLELGENRQLSVTTIRLHPAAHWLAGTAVPS